MTSIKTNIAKGLKIGDRIEIIATANAVDHHEIKYAILYLEKYGFKVSVNKDTINTSYHQKSTTTERRIRAFQGALDQPEIKAIWCARGGFGTVDIIDDINFKKIITHPKWIIGYSDITVLHSHINNMGIASIHGPMPFDFQKTDANTKDLFIKALKQTPYKITFNSKKTSNSKLEGRLFGGNLSVMYSLLGSTSFPDLTDKILFLEDIGERLYHIERMVIALKRFGAVRNLKALLLGKFTDIKDNTIPFGFSVTEIFSKHLATYDYPIISNIPTGHGRENNPLILGAEIKIEHIGEETSIHFNNE